jgi:hypothetical protein
MVRETKVFKASVIKNAGLYMVDFTKHETLNNTKGLYC